MFPGHIIKQKLKLKKRVVIIGSILFGRYLGAGRHLRPEENSKNRKIEKKIFAPAPKAGPIKNKEKSFFWGGGGAKNMSTITATPFEIST